MCVLGVVPLGVASGEGTSGVTQKRIRSGAGSHPRPPASVSSAKWADPSVGASQNFWEIKGCNHLLRKRLFDSVLPHAAPQGSFLWMLVAFRSGHVDSRT